MPVSGEEKEMRRGMQKWERNPLDMWEGIRGGIQNGYIRIADIPKLGETQWRYQYDEVCKLRAADQTGRS